MNLRSVLLSLMLFSSAYMVGCKGKNCTHALQENAPQEKSAITWQTRAPLLGVHGFMGYRIGYACGSMDRTQFIEMLQRSGRLTTDMSPVEQQKAIDSTWQIVQLSTFAGGWLSTGAGNLLVHFFAPRYASSMTARTAAYGTGFVMGFAHGKYVKTKQQLVRTVESIKPF